jgi:gluconokinase
MVVVICGVAGAGKTTLGQLLGQELGWKFYDGDDFHPAANVEKMRRGIPLTDEDRQPWLERLRELIGACLRPQRNAVLACSALKKKYRDYLRVSDEVKLVFLGGDFSLLAARLTARASHFFDPKLLRSQFADLEEPQPSEDVLVLNVSRRPTELVEEISAWLRLQSSGFKSKEEQ